MYKFFVGVDIAKYSHQAAFINAAGEKTAPDVSFDNTGEGFDLLSLALNGNGSARGKAAAIERTLQMQNRTG